MKGSATTTTKTTKTTTISFRRLSKDAAVAEVPPFAKTISREKQMLDGVAFISLPHRRDRSAVVRKELERLEVPIHHVVAERELPGFLGCALSHRKAIQQCLDSGWKTFAVFEDDFAWREDSEDPRALVDRYLGDPEWDACMLAVSYPVYDEAEARSSGLRRLRRGQTASAIIYREGSIPRRIDNLDKGISGMLRVRRRWGACSGNTPLEVRYRKFRNDMAMRDCIEKDAWVTPAKQVGFQRESWSDLECAMRDYGC